jgi:hypothetical protein
VVVPAPTSLGPNAVTPAAGLRVAPGRPASAALSSVLPLAKNSKDSVELLLDGMTGPRPDRRKTTPQSDGEASASYHARHGVHPSHALGEPGPKVVVERAAEPSSPLATADTVPTPPPPAASAAETTVVPPRALGRRIAMAVLAALLIVLAAFIAMDVGSPRAQGTAPAPAQAQAAPPATAKLSAAAPSPATSHSTEPTVASSNATASGAGPGTAPAEAEVAKPAVTVQGERPKRRRQSSGDNDDVGEFKTSF